MQKLRNPVFFKTGFLGDKIAIALMMILLDQFFYRF